MIHETVPQSPMEEVEEKVNLKKGILLNLQFGKENAIKSHELAKMIGIKSTATNQQIRKACKELLVEDRVPILSCSKGFFKAQDREEILEFQKSLASRMVGIQRDIMALNVVCEEFDG